MKKLQIIILVNLLFTLLAYPKKIALLNELLKPETLCMDDTQYYVTEGAEIFIYSFKDHKFVGKFGKAGEGPQEFKSSLVGYNLYVLPMRDHLLINSMDKLSFYKKNGEFLKELKAPTSGIPGMYKPIGGKFVGLAIKTGDDQSMAVSINLFNDKLEKEEEISSNKLLQHGSLVFPVASPLFEIKNNLIFVGGDENFNIRIFNADGKYLRAISSDYKQIQVTEEFKSGIFEAFKKNPQTKGMIDYLKKLIKFKEYFPAIQFFLIDNDKIYIPTYRKQKEDYELFIYNIDGKFIKQVYFPLKYIDMLKPCPYTIKNGVLYQLIENDEDEVWELHAVEIK
jgi:hypothetical protein